MQNRDNSGVLFANNKNNDKQPDYQGTALINGVEMRVVMWNRTSQNGKPYYSLAFEKVPEGGYQRQRPQNNGYQQQRQAPQQNYQPQGGYRQQSYPQQQPQAPANGYQQPQAPAPQQNNGGDDLPF